MNPTAPQRPETRFGLLVAVIFLATLLPRIFVHVFWRDELQSWMVAADGSPSLSTLVHRVSYEGHPLAWYLLLWLVAHVTSDPQFIKLLHAFIATGGVYLLATFMPASRVIRVLLCASYFVLFEYAAISRLYALGMLPLFGFAALRTWRPDAYVRQALCLALAAQANAYSAVLAGILAIWCGVEWLRARRPLPTHFAAAIVLLTIAFAATAVQLKGPPDRFYLPTGSTPWTRALNGLGGLWLSFMSIPLPTRFWWDSNLIDGLLAPDQHKLAKACLGLCVLIVSTWVLPSKGSSRLLWISGAALIILFQTVTFGGYLRHHGHFFVLYIIVWWLSRPHRDSSLSFSTKLRERSVLCVFAIQAIAGIAASVTDLVVPFSASEAAAKFIATNFPDAQIISKNDSVTSPIAGYLRRPIFYLRTNRVGTYIIWDTAPRNDNSSPESYTVAARIIEKAKPGRPIIAILNTNLTLLPEVRYFRPIGTFYDSSIASERYTLYEWTGDLKSPTTLP